MAPHSARVLAAVDVPTIHFGTGTATLLEEMAAAGGDVIGLDWRIPLDAGWAKVPDRAVQGNLDPAVLLAPWPVVEAEALDVLDRAGGRPGHIFNLGHGVFPSVDPDTLTRLAALVREHAPERQRRDREGARVSAGRDLGGRRLAPLPRPRPRDAHAQGSRHRPAGAPAARTSGRCATSRPRSSRARRSG